ncbi:MAG: amino acid dehydrogenase [Gammaproteobacteria bacterium]|nr:amino acid dehydrogenase [Gammaproteobacteria bacterium]
MSLFDHPDYDEHEELHCFRDPASGLRAIIAIHSTALGPAAGGCRRWQYASNDAALADALRLSRGMTYKNAIAGLPLGGGKSVILEDRDTVKSPELFAAFGRAVDSLGGRYITAEDVGITVDDMRLVRRETRYVSGLPQDGQNAGGDPSPWTALGVFLGILASAKTRLGVDSLAGLRVAVQGVGNVGMHLCRLLHGAGAHLRVADVNRRNLQRVRDEMPVSESAPNDLLFSDVDILAPCALGNILNSETIPRIRARVIAGAANNQLAVAADGARIADQGILYAPDYVINAGGIISVSREYFGNGSEDKVRADVHRIPERLVAIFEESSRTQTPTNEVADALARRIVDVGAAGKPVDQVA